MFLFFCVYTAASPGKAVTNSMQAYMFVALRNYLSSKENLEVNFL
jgi:hypothetical protein